MKEGENEAGREIERAREEEREGGERDKTNKRSERQSETR